MSPVLAITILIFAIVGGIIGWRRASRPMPRRPLVGHEEPPHDDAHQEEVRRRLHRRYRLTTIYALLGVVVGLFVLLFFDQRH